MKRTANVPGAAHPRELIHGIGYRIAFVPSEAWRPDPWAHRALEARMGASAMRSRIFADAGYRMPDLPAFVMGVHPGDVQQSEHGLAGPGYRWFVAAWTEEVEHGCPAWGAKDPA